MRGFRRAVFLGCCAACAFAPAVAAAESLLELHQLAKQNDPRYRVAQAEYRALEHALGSARASLLPNIAFELERGDSDQDIVGSQNAVFGRGRSKFPVQNDTLTITQPLINIPLMARYNKAQAELQQSAALFGAATQDLALRTATAYMAALAANDNLEFVRAEKQAIGRELQLVQERLRSGLAAITALHDVQARHALVEARELEAENERRDRLQALHEITGKAIESVRALREAIPLERPDPADPERWVVAALDQNLLLRARHAAVEAADLEVERQRAGHLPSLNLVGTVNRRKTGGSLFGGGSEVETNDVMLRLSIPIFSGFGIHSVTQEAVERRNVAKEERERVQRETERQARAAYQGVATGISRVNALRQSVVSQESALDAKQQGYRSGLFPLLAVLDAQRDLYRAKREHAQARYEYLVARLRLKQATGSLSDDDMAWIDRLQQ